MSNNEIQWIRVEDTFQPDKTSELPALLELFGRLQGAAVNATDVLEFLENQCAVFAGELNATWLAIVRRVPGPDWETVAEFGRAPETCPFQLWDSVSERECVGFLTSSVCQFALPITDCGVGRLIVGCSRRSVAELGLPITMLVRGMNIAIPLALRQGESYRQVDRLRSTLDIASRLSVNEETAPLLELIAAEAARLLDCDRSSIFLWDRERDEVEARPALGVPGSSLRVPASEGIVGETLRTGSAVTVNDAYADPRFNQAVDRDSGYRTRNLVCVPLKDSDGTIVGAFEGINRNHALDFTSEDVECLQQLGTQAAVALRNLRERSLLHRSRDQLAERVTSAVEIIGESSAISALRDTIRRLASTDLPVLILGESGTGKEVAAQSLHYQGDRALSPFVAVNCAALTESLLESELFGHEQGAFTDARDTRKGKFELADGGTLFLDEIGDMSPGGQAKLLRVLEQKLITRVGGSQAIPIDVRIIAATNANLPESVREKRFREDLYYRLSVVTLDLPALRDRPEDILPLAEYFIAGFSAQARRADLQFTNEARRRLQTHQWPGNIRELRNLMERVAFLCPNDKVDVDDLAFILSPEDETGKLPSLELGLEKATRAFQRDFIRRSIHQVKENMTEAAKLLGLHRSNLYRKMKQLGMSEVDGEE
ncbi:MAG: sigma-54-dependent Fis family transcriptional regulator [Fuerstiella sp.]|nr:sigma-54-dependent Fis family transcriptional regulator [Fuerstiella sp.]